MAGHQFGINLASIWVKGGAMNLKVWGGRRGVNAFGRWRGDQYSKNTKI